MEHKKKPVIVFLTYRWSNVDKNIREGRKTGGTASVARSWETCLANGFETHVFVICQYERGWPKETEHLGGVRFHWIQERFRRTNNWFQQKGLAGFCKPLWLVRQLQMLYRVRKANVRPDIIYCMRSTFLVAGWLWSRLTGAKLIWRQYGTYGVYDAWFQRKNWLARLHVLGELLAYRIPVDLLIITNDGTEGDKVAPWAGLPMERLRFWLNGVNKSLRVPDFDADSFKQDIGLSRDSLMILMLGRLCRFKRVDRMINAMPDICKEITQAQLVIVGDGELRGELEGQVKSLGLSNSVIFTGSVPNEDVYKYLNASDVFVTVSICSNLSATLLEAMSAGCCILTLDVGATTQVAIDGVNSVVLDDPAPPFIAKGIVRLLKNREERARLAKGAYQYAMENFQTWDERIQMEVDELKSLLEDG